MTENDAKYFIMYCKASYTGTTILPETRSMFQKSDTIWEDVNGIVILW